MDGSQLEVYCNQIRHESTLLHQAIQKREKELIRDATAKFNDVKKEYKVKQKMFESLALRMSEIKKTCDDALNMSGYNQLEARRNIICSTVGSVKKAMDDAMGQSVDASMKTVNLDLSDCKAINDKISTFGEVYVQFPCDICIKNVTMNKNKFKIVWDIKNGEYLYQNCNELAISVIKQSKDEKPDDETKENIFCSKRVEGDLSAIRFAELEMDKNKLERNCTLVFRINVLNKAVDKCYKYELSDRVEFAGYVTWYQKSEYTCEGEDTAMNKACSEKFRGSRAATDLEVIESKISGLVKSVQSKIIFAHSGKGDQWKANEYNIPGGRHFARRGWWQKWPMTGNNYSGNCLGNEALAIAVRDNMMLKEVKI